jgi:hypothetical protein
MWMLLCSWLQEEAVLDFIQDHGMPLEELRT